MLKKRVLIVEDEALLALDIAEELNSAGFTVLGPAASVVKALDLVREEGCDAAILDVNIRDETSEKIAATLREAGTPFCFLSGISKDECEPWMSNAPFVSKPVDFDNLFVTLNGLFEITDKGL